MQPCTVRAPVVRDGASSVFETEEATIGQQRPLVRYQDHFMGLRTGFRAIVPVLHLHSSQRPCIPRSSQTVDGCLEEAMDVLLELWSIETYEEEKDWNSSGHRSGQHSA